MKTLTAWMDAVTISQQVAFDTPPPRHEQLRRRRNLRLLVSLLSAGSLCILLLILFTPPFPAAGLDAENMRVAAVALAMLLAGGLALLLARRCVELGAFVYLAALTASIALADSPHEMVAGHTLVVFAVPILAAGAVLPSSAPFLFAAFASVLVAVVGNDEVEPLPHLVAVLTFFMLAGVAWLSAASLERFNRALCAANLHLRQRESDFRLLFADNPLPMVLVDLQTCHVVEANQAAIAQSGFGRPELLDYQVNEVARRMFDVSAAAIARGETVYAEQVHHDAGGRAVHVEVTAHRVVYGGQPVALVIAQDITARWEAEEAVRALNAELERRVEERTAELRQVNAALERSSRHKDEFLANMSHELRTPLTGILGSADVLGGEHMGPLTARQARSIQLIRESGEHLLSLINSVLDLSKLEAGRMAVESEPLLVRDVCLSALHIVQPQAKAKGQIVTFASTPDNFWLQADMRRLKQILINLLANAVKFTPDNGSIRLDVEADFAQELARFCVSDDGIGIAAEEMPHLFEPFYQAHRGLNRLYNGAGLGLPLAQKLTQLHGGSIEVASTLGQGSRFTVLLPCRPQPLAPALSFTADKTNLDIPDLAGLCGRRPVVLLAEDHAGSVDVLRSIMEMANCDLAVASRGDDAVEMVKTSQFDLVLMDIQMPGMDGLAAMRAIRGLPGPAASVPIIALTAMALWDDRDRCLSAGANDYISKPIDLGRLFGAMQEQLDGRARRCL